MIRGACPGLHAPMQTADGLLVRVKPPAGRLAADAAERLAAAVAAHGNGIIELTGRANLQVRGLTAADAPRFATAVVQAGLAHPDPATERRRNLLAPPLAGADPACGTDAEDLVAALEAMLVANPALDALPDKFLFAIDAGGRCPTPPIADITLRSDGRRHWIIAGGQIALCPPGQGIATAAALACLAGTRRMRAIPPGDIFARLGLAAEPLTTRSIQPVAGPVPATDAFACALPFGQTDAVALAALAALARRFGDGQLRLATGRTLFIAGVTQPASLAAAVAALGLIVDPADPRLRIAACIGSPGCASATTPTRHDARLLADTPFSGVIHVAGCAKGCAHGPADLTLVGRDGRYDLVRQGGAGDSPSRRGLSLEDVRQALA